VGLDRAALEGLRQMILADGARQLAVGYLCVDDLAGLAWSGNPAHLRSVAAALQRVAQGLEDYLVVREPGGQSVAKMRVDYTTEAGTGVFSQLAVMGPLQGLGIATMLIGAGEPRAHPRPGLRRARRRRRQCPGAPPLRTARIPGGRPPARVMGNRGRRRRPAAVRNYAHDSAQALVTSGR